MRKLSLVLVFFSLTAVVVASTWITTFRGQSTQVIQSNTPIKFISYLNSSIVDLTNTSFNTSEYVEVTSRFQNAYLDVTCNTTKTDVEDDCYNYTYDCNVTCSPSTPIYKNEVVKIWVNTSCIQGACPQNITTEINIIGYKT